MLSRLLPLALVLFLAFAGSGFADQDLLLHLRFDEGSGTVANDSSGRDRHARLVNATWEEFGQQGRAIRLNGKDAYVELPAHEEFDNLQKFTFSLWFKAAKFEHGMSLFSRGGGRQKGWSTYVFRTFVALAGEGLRPAPVLYTRFAAGIEPIHPFYHLMITGEPDPENEKQMLVRYYVNGQLRRGRSRAEMFQTGGFLTAPPQPITIGKYISDSSRSFDGIIDEAKIWRRKLSDEEIAAEYKAGSVTEPRTADNELPTLQPVNFPPLKKLRLAIYEAPEECGAKPVQTLEWFEEQAQRHGVQTTRLGNREVGDPAVLNIKNFDTLLLPVDIMPLKGEDSIFQFLQAGGNLITTTIVPAVFNLDENGKALRDDKGKIIFKQHSRGWFAPFLVRHLDRSWGWPVRKVTAPLRLNQDAAAITGDCLPAEFPADPKISYTPADNWSNVSRGDGNYGGGGNVAQAADVKLDLYREANGIGSDFIAYRYYNNLIFGATFVELGKVGTKLLQGEEGPKVFQAILHLLESKLPGEQGEKYYRNVVKLHQEWSDLGFLYFETLAALRDAVIAMHLTGADYEPFNKTIKAFEESFNALSSRRQEQLQQLVNRESPEKIAVSVHVLLSDVASARSSFQAVQPKLRQLLSGCNLPSPVPVRHKYGRIPSIASLTLPTSLNRLRGRLFDTMRTIGVDVYAGPCHPWYAADQQVRENFAGIRRDHQFVYPASARYITGGGIINPSNGTVTEREPVDYPYERLRNYLQTMFDNWAWKGKEVFRVGTADESGLGYQYWGKAAAEDLRKNLRQYYDDDIKAMNSHCGTSYNDFNDVELPVRKPETPAEHAVWEHWRQCREAKLESLYSNFTQLVKSLKPDLDVYHMPSTGARQSPLYGVNFYNVTKYQDVNAIDGTACVIRDEWLYADLTRVRTHTGEWGGLYSRSAPTYVNGKLWEELSAGALGFEQHVWSFGSDSVSFADNVDIATIYGNLLKMTLQDARKISHVILDGQRATPEIGIVFSQTTRVHDQGWGWAGEKTVSPHMQTVGNYYELFLKFHRSTRVMPEEMLVEDSLPPVNVLFLPQANFLSQKTQEKLLAYVEQGGTLIIEGRAGEFDEFGQKSDYLFQSLGVVPSFTDAKSLRISGREIAVSSSDRLFAPTGRGEVLSQFGEAAAAILSVPHGRGRAVVLGFNPGLHRYAALPAVTEYLLRQLEITAKFQVSDDSLILREWTYGDDTYLLLVSRAADWAAKEVTVKIRGQVRVEDYLFGKNVKVDYQDGYTSFNTLTVNGGRVFRLPGAKLANTRENPALFAEAKKQPLQFTLGEASGTTDDYQVITMPYDGRLYDTGPLKYQDYVFYLTTISSGSNAGKGDMFLTISKDKDERRLHLTEGEDHFFRFRERIFKVHSKRNFYMYPFYCELTIEEVTVAPEGGNLNIKKKIHEVEFSNSLIALVVDSTQGAAIKSIKPLDEKAEQVYEEGNCFAATGGLPGPFAGQTFELDVKTHHEQQLVADFSLKSPSQGQDLKQTIAMQKHRAGFDLTLSCRNAQTLQQTFDMRWHPKLTIGGAADPADCFYIPSGGKVQDIPFRALNGGYGLPPSEDWAAIVDKKQKLAYVTSFNREQVRQVYVWEASQFYTFEIFTPRASVQPNESLQLDLGFDLLRGLSGVDAWSHGAAVFVSMPPFINQMEPADFTVQLATSLSIDQQANITCELWQDNRKIEDFGQLEAKLAFDWPVSWQFSQNLAMLPDGEYQLQCKVRIGKEQELTVNKQAALAGQALTKLLQTYEQSKSQLDKADALPNKDLFARRVLLEEARRAIAEGEVKTAEKLLGEYQKLP